VTWPSSPWTSGWGPFFIAVGVRGGVDCVPCVGVSTSSAYPLGVFACLLGEVLFYFSLDRKFC
jgi:hypothetical protein